LIIDNLNEETKSFNNGFSIMIENKILLVDMRLDEKTLLIKENIKLKELKSGSKYDFHVKIALLSTSLK
jgi:hypothetical protein